MQTKFKAIFLDVDGVLVDSEPIFNLCWRKAAEQEGYSMTYEQALQLRSLDVQLAQQLFISWYGDENAYPSIRATRKKIMADLTAQHPIKAKEGVLEFLQRVKNYPIMVAIVTSSPLSRITSYLASVSIDIKLFDKVITTEQVQRGKPFPDVYQHACKSIGLEPHECIAVEDSPNGLKAAHDAGCFTIMVPDLTGKDEVDEAVVDMEVKKIDQLIHHYAVLI